ncbi:uncharacterized protein Tco025E_09987, partial [Trypanosoma conorhini]
MGKGFCDFVTPLFEITYMRDPPPFFLEGPLERVGGWSVYREPPLCSRGSEKRYKCTHQHVLHARLPYKLSTVTGDPVPSIDMDPQLFLRYQLNPYRPPHSSLQCSLEGWVYRNQRP